MHVVTEKLLDLLKGRGYAPGMPEDLLFARGYYDQPISRRALNELVGEVFGIDFGLWNSVTDDHGPYTPFSLWAGEEIVANVSASPMDLVVAGKRVRAVQIGTVATRPSWRGRGLIRTLMERVDEEFGELCDLMFLFASDETMEFYEQFGFRRVEEHGFTVPMSPAARKSLRHRARRLDLSDADDLRLLKGLADRRTPVSQTVGVRDHTWLLLFHAAVRYPDDLFHIRDLDVVTIHRQMGRKLFLADVIGREIPTLSHLLPYIADDGVYSLELGFVPDRMGVDGLKTEPDPDSGLFVRGELQVEGRPFRFPETSQA